MKKIITIVALLAYAAAAQAQMQIPEAPEVKTAEAPQSTPATDEQSEWLASFSSVDISGPFDITFTAIAQSQAPRIVYDTKGSYTSKFKAEVKDKVLRITERTDARRTTRTSVTVYYHELSMISIYDAVATFTGTLSQPMLDLRVGGSASVTTALAVKDLMMELSGRSTATLSGKASYLTLMVTTGKVDASKLDVMSARVNVTGSGTATLWVNDRFEGKTSTGGKLSYRGAPLVVRSGSKFMGGDIIHVE